MATPASPSRKIYAAGSGLDMFSQPDTVKEVIELSGVQRPRVLYLGTATYDNPAAQQKQTQGFSDLGCIVEALAVSWVTPTPDALAQAFAHADIVLVSGGNTLFARDRWVKLGIDKLIRGAISRGSVMAGGSAGGIVWFDGGHSDSMDATTYKNPPGPLYAPNLSSEVLEAAWAYVRVPGLGVLPGLFCPHYDVVEGNGVLRATSFTNTLQRHSGEYGIAVDNWAALRIDGQNYRVISRDNKTGSVGPDGQFTSNFSIGRPGAWTMQISKDGQLNRELVPTMGLVDKMLSAANYVVADNILDVARLQNPDDGKPAAWNITQHKKKLPCPKECIGGACSSSGAGCDAPACQGCNCYSIPPGVTYCGPSQEDLLWDRRLADALASYAGRTQVGT